ncbi:unnamed protein product [Closterium sp. Naga37s-1]|nr:unnamed protein product [Closterium sp. Naga37s-1]
MAISCCGASPPRCLLVSLLLLSLSVLRIHARHGPEVAVADAMLQSRSIRGGDAANSHRRFDSESKSPEVLPQYTKVAESIAEWKRRSAEAGAHFFPLQRAEDAPSREEIHRRILAPSVSAGVQWSGGCQEQGIAAAWQCHTRFVYPYYVNLKLGSQKLEFSMALDLMLQFTFVPCDCLHCGTMRKGTTYSKPFSSLSSTTLKYISCVDQRCQGGGFFYGCNTEGLPNYLNTTGVLPGDDALCVYSAYNYVYDYYEDDSGTKSYYQSVGHVVEDTVYLPAPDGTEVNRSIIFGCGVNQHGMWGMQGWESGSWSAGGVLGLGYYSPFLWQLTGPDVPTTFAVCLEEPTPTNKTGWDGKVPLQTGSSHLTIGATGLPAGASYATM